jgi:hypothetical protein
MLHMRMEVESCSKLLNLSTGRNVYVNVTHEDGGRVLLETLGRNIFVNVTHEDGWRVMLETIESIDWKKCLCKCYA